MTTSAGPGREAPAPLTHPSLSPIFYSSHSSQEMDKENPSELTTLENNGVSLTSTIRNSHLPLLIDNHHSAAATIQQSTNAYEDDSPVRHRNRLTSEDLIKRNAYMENERSHPPPNAQPQKQQSIFLPDDILHEIFSRALRVSDSDFRIDVNRSPFGRRSPSAVNILLVCRQWYRVGHPYLYECLVLRNSFQLQSFYNMLMWYKKGKTAYQKMKMARIRLGVRRLRMEIAFGPLLSKLLKLLDVSRIASLFINVDRCDDEKRKPAYSGTIAAINSINPNRLVLDWRVATSLPPVKFIDTMIEKVPQWHHLKTLEVYTHHTHLSMLSALVEDLLKTGTNLSEIRFYLRSQRSLRQLVPILWHCQESASKPMIGLVIDTPFSETEKAAEEVKGRFSMFPRTLKFFSSYRTPGIFLSLSRPRKNGQASQGHVQRLPLRAILKIVHYYLENPRRIANEGEYTDYLDRYRKIKEISRSKDFHNYCAVKCWKILYIPNKRKLEYLSNKNVFLLDSDGSIKRRLDQLIINSGFLEPESWRRLLPPVVDHFFEAMLRKVSFLNIPLRHSMLPGAPNEELHTLTLNITHPCSSAESFLSTDPDTSSDVARIFSCFPKVQKLHLTGCSLAEGHLLARPTSYLHQCSIRILQLDGTDESLFIISKCMFVSVMIMYLDFKMSDSAVARPVDLTTVLYHTPNIRGLIISMESYKMCFFETLEPNRSIQKIAFSGPWQDTGFLALVDILERIDFGLFESLKEVQFWSFGGSWEWTRDELDIYIKWTNLAEQARKKYGIKFTNCSGVVWAPRLTREPQSLPQPQLEPRPNKRKRNSS